jgi:phosphoribosylglycinamide formyltransferase 1
MNLAFFTGAHGGDYLAVQRAIDTGLVDGRVVAMVATDKASGALGRYRQSPGADWRVLDFTGGRRTADFAEARSFLAAHAIDLVLLAGFPFIVPADLVADYQGCMVNAHHSLLPAHPGLYRKEARVSSTDRFLGATVHLVDAGIDTGDILYQAVFPNTGMDDFDGILRRYRRAQDLMIVQCVRDLGRGRRRGHAFNRRNDTVFSPAIDADIFEGMKDG